MEARPPGRPPPRRSPRTDAWIGVPPGREFRAEPLERFPVERRRNDRLPVASVGRCATHKIHNDRIARVAGRRVGTHSVHADHIGFVLDRPGPEQRTPHLPPRFGPRGAIYDRIVIVAAAAPHGEAQVVADEQQQAQAAVLHHHTFRPGREQPAFAADGEQMAFVVSGHLARRTHEELPVEIATVVPNDGAARQGASRAAGILPHPGDDTPVHRLRDPARVEHETRGEHFGQHDQPGLRRSDHPSRFGQVARNILPAHIELAECDT